MRMRLSLFFYGHSTVAALALRSCYGTDQRIDADGNGADEPEQNADMLGLEVVFREALDHGAASPASSTQISACPTFTTLNRPRPLSSMSLAKVGSPMTS